MAIKFVCDQTAVEAPAIVGGPAPSDVRPPVTWLVVRVQEGQDTVEKHFVDKDAHDAWVAAQ